MSDKEAVRQANRAFYDAFETLEVEQTGVGMGLFNLVSFISGAVGAAGDVAGRGAVREVCELILSARGSLEAAIQRYLA